VSKAQDVSKATSPEDVPTFNGPSVAAADFAQPNAGARTVSSFSDGRTANNVMRHEYRVLSDDEKAMMLKIKDDGKALHDYLDSLGVSRELSVAKTKLEEAVMWAVKHLTR
jgi:hypothetical protein